MLYRKTMKYKIARSDLEAQSVQQIAFNKKRQSTEEVFPMVGLVAMWYGPDVYNRVIDAYKNKTNAKVLAEYVEYLIFQSTQADRNSVSNRDVSFLRQYVKSNLSDDVCVSLAREHNITAARVRQAISHAANRAEIPWKMLTSYINGDINAIVAEMPKNWQKTFAFQKQQNIADGSTAEFNAAGQWLMDNFSGHTKD